MNESIYNNAGMPSEQGAAPEIPESAQVQRYRADIGGDNTVWPIVVSDAKGPLCYYRDHQKRIAALTLERDTLKAERDERAEQVRRYDKSVGVLMETMAALKAKVERLSAPVSGDVATLLCNLAQILDVVKIEWAESWSEWDQQQRDAITSFLTTYYARASTPPAHPISDDDQRRKDAAWNDRPKARCVCGETIAWYSGEWLHVAGRSKSCADGRLASPAHFLVGRTSAESGKMKGSGVISTGKASSLMESDL